MFSNVLSITETGLFIAIYHRFKALTNFTCSGSLSLSEPMPVVSIIPL